LGPALFSFSPLPFLLFLTGPIASLSFYLEEILLLFEDSLQEQVPHER